MRLNEPKISVRNHLGVKQEVSIREVIDDSVQFSSLWLLDQRAKSRLIYETANAFPTGVTLDGSTFTRHIENYLKKSALYVEGSGECDCPHCSCNHTTED